jgi:acetyl/propionyl-CoA carboxylase alpha subunit
MAATTAPFRVNVNNGQHQLEVTSAQAQALDVIQDGDQWHVLIEGQRYVAELASVDYAKRTYTFRVNGQVFTTHISDHYERLIEQMGLQAGATQKQNTVKAPMPGLVIKIAVEAGQAVSKGDPLIILEAMKMENVLKAVHDAVVKSIKVSSGAAVEKGQLLIELE